MSYWAVRTLRRIARDLRSFEDGRIPNDAVDGFVLNLKIAYRELLVQELLDGLYLEEAGGLIEAAMENLRQLQCEEMNSPQPTLPVVHSGNVGRPRFDLPQCQITALVESGFTGVQIANIVGVSLSTIRRRMAEYGISISSQYSELSDQDLDQLVGSIKEEFPTCGYKQMLGHLKAQGYRIQQNRV